MKKRSLDSSDSLGALISICPSTDPREEEHSREFGMDGLEEEESGMVREKKRRLSVEQVKALEKHFEVENKLEPERKTKMAEELGLQPRQVAVWFQNRRARWKTKQLEKDYSILKSSFDSLHQHFVSLQQENESLKKKIRELNEEEEEEEEKTEMGIVKEEEEEATTKVEAAAAAAAELGSVNEATMMMMGSESDSSVVLNSPNSTSNDDVMMIQASSISYFNLSEGSVKMEEHDFLGEEGCNFFPEDQAPTLHWYFNPDDQWTT